MNAGDVCRGNTVLFTQKVYVKFDKVTRHGGLIRKRTVAGRVVKESYGASKQQHTFTINLFASNIHCNDYVAVSKFFLFYVLWLIYLSIWDSCFQHL
uniref:DUF7699 domain-containing protein n=1 Tax=Cucumis melo TaxID=3656 RepID=A0A9I9E5P7_CUCME